MVKLAELKCKNSRLESRVGRTRSLSSVSIELHAVLQVRHRGAAPASPHTNTSAPPQPELRAAKRQFGLERQRVGLILSKTCPYCP